MTDISPPRSPSRNPSRRSAERARFSPVTLIIPVAVVYRFALLLPTTTSLKVMQLVACRIWYHWNDPSTIPAGESCLTPGVDQYYSAIASILAICDGISGIFGCGVASFLSATFGRKPVLLGIIFIGIVDYFLLFTAQLLQGWRQIVAFAIWWACEMTGSTVAIYFVINAYIIDLAQAEERSVTLSRITGWKFLGSALSFSLGGLITARADDTTSVFIISLGIFVLLLSYTAVALPESFSASKREELRRERAAAAHSSKSWIQKLKSSTAIVSEPLQTLKPDYNPLTGRLNWRLVYCAIHIFIVTVADGYASTAMMLYFNIHYKYTPAQTGYVLTIYNITNVVVLTALVPLVVRLARPFYERQEPTGLSEPETPAGDSSNYTEITDEGVPNEVVSSTSDHLDVHIALVSWAVESLAYIAVGATTTVAAQLLAVSCIGLGAGRAPMFRSLVAASVEPLKQGEALASIEMVFNMATMLSPILMGNIMTLTISTSPQMIFYVHAAIVASGAAVLFFVKDSDRYQKPAILLEPGD
ncbi:hypothetical protein GALMADRAFT_138183 [Galerina marginata CBS 339.88]|uniref:Major facilitator superfamily (MFS) profile domain-containing protein n=1 Tax=Galerina marginata (strain CBS 339.88) TaxID=685588 RepID=A0A067T4I8_GALM3|nr:hypothetical protein GALMADRAFT_138183 [Galerina marginata CBS 339.88]